MDDYLLKNYRHLFNDDEGAKAELSRIREAGYQYRSEIVIYALTGDFTHKLKDYEATYYDRYHRLQGSRGLMNQRRPSRVHLELDLPNLLKFKHDVP